MAAVWPSRPLNMPPRLAMSPCRPPDPLALTPASCITKPSSQLGVKWWDSQKQVWWRRCYTVRGFKKGLCFGSFHCRILLLRGNRWEAILRVRNCGLSVPWESGLGCSHLTPSVRWGGTIPLLSFRLSYISDTPRNLSKAYSGGHAMVQFVPVWPP